jgi:hypothetical protein
MQAILFHWVWRVWIDPRNRQERLVIGVGRLAGSLDRNRQLAQLIFLPLTILLFPAQLAVALL